MNEPEHFSFPMLDGPPISWGMAKHIYDTLYVHLGGRGQSLERVGERGGFGWAEVGVMYADAKKRKPHLIDAARKYNPTADVQNELKVELECLKLDADFIQKDRDKLRAELKKIKKRLVTELPHGDANHVLWLIGAINAIFTDKPIRPATGVGERTDG